MVYGVSPSKVGWTEEVKGAPATGQILQAQAFKEKAIYPIMEKLAWYFTQEIIYDEFKNDKLKFEFIEEVSLQDKMLKAQIHQYEIMGQWKSVAEIRKEEGLEVQEGGMGGQPGMPGQEGEEESPDIAGLIHGLRGEEKPTKEQAYKDLADNIKQYLGGDIGGGEPTTPKDAYKRLEENIKTYIGKSITQEVKKLEKVIKKSLK